MKKLIDKAIIEGVLGVGTFHRRDYQRKMRLLSVEIDFDRIYKGGWSWLGIFQSPDYRVCPVSEDTIMDILIEGDRYPLMIEKGQRSGRVDIDRECDMVSVVGICGDLRGILNPTLTFIFNGE